MNNGLGEKGQGEGRKLKITNYELRIKGGSTFKQLKPYTQYPSAHFKFANSQIC